MKGCKLIGIFLFMSSLFVVHMRAGTVEACKWTHPDGRRVLMYYDHSGIVVPGHFESILGALTTRGHREGVCSHEPLHVLVESYGCTQEYNRVVCFIADLMKCQTLLARFNTLLGVELRGVRIESIESRTIPFLLEYYWREYKMRHEKGTGLFSPQDYDFLEKLFSKVSLKQLVEDNQRVLEQYRDAYRPESQEFHMMNELCADFDHRKRDFLEVFEGDFMDLYEMPLGMVIERYYGENREVLDDLIHSPLLTVELLEPVLLAHALQALLTNRGTCAFFVGFCNAFKIEKFLVSLGYRMEPSVDREQRKELWLQSDSCPQAPKYSVAVCEEMAGRLRPVPARVFDWLLE
jgi:hypothetical protein